MARDITTINQTNLWGKQADSGLGLEPQRNDLYFVDFSSALKNVQRAANVSPVLAPMLPQYVRSVTLPELRTKPDVVRRDSIPYNMPSWDDPLDPIKITFLLDTNEQDDRSDVTRFLDAWLALTRAGRGSRFQGYTAPQGHLLLNADYRVDFQFNVNLYLLRGANVTVGGFVNDGRDDEQFKVFTAQANAAFRNLRKAAGAVQQGNPIPDPNGDNSFETAVTYAQLDQGASVEQDMVISTIYVLYNAWLGAYKISDLTYTESALVTVEATFYADSVQVQTPAGISGSAQIVGPANVNA